MCKPKKAAKTNFIDELAERVQNGIITEEDYWGKIHVCFSLAHTFPILMTKSFGFLGNLTSHIDVSITSKSIQLLKRIDKRLP